MDSLEPCWLLFRLKKYELAEAKVLEYLAKQPESHDAFGLRSLICLNHKRIDEALTYANQTVALAPESGWAHYILSNALMYSNDQSRAIRHAESAVSLEPYVQDFHHHLVRVLVHFWRLDLAHKCIFRALAVDPEHVPTIREYGKLKYRLDEYRAAEVLLRYALSLNPEDKETLEALGWLNLDQHQHDRALNFFSSSLALDPTNTAAVQGLEYASKHRADFDLSQQLNRWLAKQDAASLLYDRSDKDAEQSLESKVKEIIIRDVHSYFEPEELIDFQSGQALIVAIPESSFNSRSQTISTLAPNSESPMPYFREVIDTEQYRTDFNEDEQDNGVDDLSPRTRKIFLYILISLIVFGLIVHILAKF